MYQVYSFPSTRTRLRANYRECVLPPGRPAVLLQVSQSVRSHATAGSLLFNLLIMEELLRKVGSNVPSGSAFLAFSRQTELSVHLSVPTSYQTARKSMHAMLPIMHIPARKARMAVSKAWLLVGHDIHYYPGLLATSL